MYAEERIYDSLRIDENMIIVTVFLLIINTKQNSVWFIISKKTVTAIIFSSI